MTDTQIFEPEGRAIPYVEEGDSPVRLVLVPEPGQDRDALGVVSHYLAEEAGFHVVRVGFRAEPTDADVAVTLDDRVDDLTAVMDHLGWDHAWIGGHGFGGTVARAAVAAHAERANGLLLLGVEDEDIALARRPAGRQSQSRYSSMMTAVSTTCVRGKRCPAPGSVLTLARSGAVACRRSP